MKEVFRDEVNLNTILADNWKNISEDGERTKSQATEADGSTVETFTRGPWSLVESYHHNDDYTLYHGRLVAVRDAVPVWAASYHTVISDPKVVDKVFSFYQGKVAANPSPQLAVTCANNVSGNLTFESAPIDKYPAIKQNIGNFAIKETITILPDQILMTNVVIGGWIN